MDVRGSVVLRDCIAQLCYANDALCSRDTTRTRSRARLLRRPRSSSKEIGCCILTRTTGAPCDSFSFCSPYTFAITVVQRISSRAQVGGEEGRRRGGNVDHGNKLCFISRKIYLPRGTYQRGTKIRVAKIR